MTDSALPTGSGGVDAGTDARATAAARRLQSLDAFRGLIMLMMGSAGLAFGEVARRVPGRAWHILALQTDHTRWVGCSVWDFIQPCFMFMVGVAVPYSHARREALGHTRARILAHAVQRAAILACAGAGLIAVGLGAGLTVCPIIKKIWTPSWTLVSGGAAVWVLAAFYGAIDVAGWRRWTFPLVVVGTNSISAYLFVDALWMPHWGPADRARYFLSRWEEFNPVLLPLVPLAGLAAVWLICRWMYRRKVFLRI